LIKEKYTSPPPSAAPSFKQHGERGAWLDRSQLYSSFTLCNNIKTEIANPDKFDLKK
jgi:hypothetical protein